MSRYKIGEHVFIANAMISVCRKENRWIIDEEDVKNFKIAAKKIFDDKKFYFEVESCTYGQIESYLSDYIAPIGKDGLPSIGASFYALLPWRNIDELREHFRFRFPVDAMFGYFEEQITQVLSKRDSQELETLKEPYSLFLDNLSNQTNQELAEIRNKATVLQKKISHISDIRNKYN